MILFQILLRIYGTFLFGTFYSKGPYEKAQSGIYNL